jgi:hypothetical protein
MSRSRISRKSELSPSITKSNGIDLGKNSGGRKSEPSLTSGGIGITQEVTSIGGASVSAGIEIDLTPVDFGVAFSSEGSVAVSGGAEIPGGLLGVSGGIEIDLNTGEVIGGSIGGEVGGLGINLSNSKKGGLGIEFTVQIPGTPIELSLGFGFPPILPTPAPTPTPTPIKNLPPRKEATKHLPPPVSIESVRGCTLKISYTVSSTQINPYSSGCDVFLRDLGPVSGKNLGLQAKACTEDIWDYQGLWSMYAINGKWTMAYEINRKIPNDYSQSELDYLLAFTYYFMPPSYFYYDTEGELIDIGGGFPTGAGQEVTEPTISIFDCLLEKENPIIYTPSPTQETPPSPFPNPPPRRQNKMDACCRENLAFLRAIYTKLGLARFPGQLPTTIIQEVPKEGEEPAEPAQVPIPDLVTLLNWQFERDDERWGQWEVQIDIKDSDITKEGDQKKSIKFPNLAESVAELEGQMLSIMTNVDGLVALQVKNLAESGMARQEAIKGYLASKAIIKYMAFKSTEIDIPVPMTFTAGAETISELLKESEGHIKGTDYVEKETLRDVYLDLLQAAAIIRAVHWQRIDTKTDTKSQLLSILKGSVDLAASIVKPQSPNENGSEKTFDPEKNFEDFIDSVENGFRDSTGITDIQNPYGKPPNRRPRIRQIGDNISQAGGNN